MFRNEKDLARARPVVSVVLDLGSKVRERCPWTCWSSPFRPNASTSKSNGVQWT
jgi:hypothetical protein